MKARELFLKYLTIKQRLLSRPNAVITSKKGPHKSAWFKSLRNVQDEASRMNVVGLPETEITLLNQIIGDSSNED